MAEVCGEKALSAASGLRLFSPGKVVMTSSVAELFKSDPTGPVKWLNKHLKCDWGNLSADDMEANIDALRCGRRLFSSYDLGPESSEPKLWIITEADRSVTTLLLPSDY